MVAVMSDIYQGPDVSNVDHTDSSARQAFLFTMPDTWIALTTQNSLLQNKRL
jgi:hypothetical protein